MAPPTDRQTFREAVADVAAKAKAKLPQETNGRVESAVKLVLAGNVFFKDDGSIEVGSASHPETVYTLAGQACDCQDYAYGKAPQGWCQHRIAAGIARRVAEMVPQSTPVETEPAPAPVAPLPEAPASVNLRAMLGAFEVQITLRDHDEGALLARLEGLLKRHGLKPVPKPAPRTGQWRKGH